MLLTPSVSHIFKKARKASHTLALNSITAIAEIKRLKEKNLKRESYLSRTLVIRRYRPLTVYNTRLRLAKNNYNKQAKQAAKEERICKKEAHNKVAYL